MSPCVDGKNGPVKSQRAKERGKIAPLATNTMKKQNRKPTRFGPGGFVKAEVNFAKKALAGLHGRWSVG
jgi:hypothetical protein